LDAPPHYEPQVLDELKSSVKALSEKGIKLIPISASGVDKATEFLMRMVSIATNSTYVFITNDSGIGNDHIEASVGEYEVEYLNELMLRLIEEYSE
jgi:primase-polymerase (primpol)-like protein